MADLRGGESLEEREVEDFPVTIRQPSQGRADPSAFFLGDEGRKGIWIPGGELLRGSVLKGGAAGSCVQEICDDVPGDAPDEGPEFVGSSQSLVAQSLHRSDQGFLNRLLGGIGIPEGAQRHDLHPEPELLHSLQLRPGGGGCHDRLLPSEAWAKATTPGLGRPVNRPSGN
jgi:hypothetical protein